MEATELYQEGMHREEENHTVDNSKRKYVT